PCVSLLMPVRGPDDLPLLDATIASVRPQCYERWELLLACDERLQLEVARKSSEQGDDRVRLVFGTSAEPAAAFRAALNSARGELFGAIDPGDVLEPSALFELAYAFNRCPENDLVYSDEEVPAPSVNAEPGAPCEKPLFKPDWSPV